MQKISYKLLIVLVIIVTLALSALALALSEEPVISVEETIIEIISEPVIPDDEAMITDTVLLEELMLADEEIMIIDTIEIHGKTIPLTESVKDVPDISLLKEEHFIEFTDWEASTDDIRMVDRDTALKAALPMLHAISVGVDAAEKANIALIKFSDLVLKADPESGASFTDIPVWLVTVEKLETRKHGPGPTDDSPNTAISIVDVVVDAYSGEILTVFAYCRDE